MKSKMKYILIGLLLLSGFSNVRAQDALDKFRQEMGKLESLESEYHKVIFGKKDYPKHYTDSIGKLFQAIRQEKRVLRKRLSITTVRINGLSKCWGFTCRIT